MAKRLSEHLRDLSARAKGVEDTYEVARKEAREKLAARREQARTAAMAAVQRVHDEVKSNQGTVSRNWNALKQKSPPTCKI